MADDESDRDAILRRRNRFIAIALSGLTSAVGPGCDEAPSDTVGQTGELTEQVPPEPCLEAPIDMYPLEEDASAAEPDAGPPDAGPPDAGVEATKVRTPPRPCLRVRPHACLSRRPPPPPPPQVCLSPFKPGGTGGGSGDAS